MVKSAAILIALGLSFLTGCSQSEISTAIEQQLMQAKGGSVDLSSAVPGNWDSVCILGPYSTNRVARTTLGFDWDVESRTTIATNESGSLLLFVQGGTVVAHVEHPRNKGDFSNLTTKCFPRLTAQFSRDPAFPESWPTLRNAPT